MTREEHTAWCKKRALEYLPHDPDQACTSMMSDLGKHEETRGLALTIGPLYLYAIRQRDAVAARRFIEGFQ